MTLELILRIFVAAVLGGLIGLEREYQAIRLDVSRIAAQVVTGIGFIGAGTIIFQKNVVRGLTTAAGVWVTAAIGLACGGGLYIIASVSTFLVLLGLEAFNYFLRRFDRHHEEYNKRHSVNDEKVNSI